MLQVDLKSKAQEVVDLKVFYSRTEEEPCENSHDRVIHNPGKVIILTNDGKDKFETESVYLSLYSLTGCFVTLTLHMKEEVHHKYGLRQIRVEREEERDENNKMLNYFKTFNNRYDSSVDFMEKNLITTAEYNELDATRRV